MNNPDPAADRILNDVLSSIRESRAKLDTKKEESVTVEKTRVAEAVGASTIDEPLVVKLVGQYGKVPDSLLKDIANKRLRWGL